jgi:hypothetical protein
MRPPRAEAVPTEQHVGRRPWECKANSLPPQRVLRRSGASSGAPDRCPAPLSALHLQMHYPTSHFDQRRPEAGPAASRATGGAAEYKLDTLALSVSTLPVSRPL